MKNTGKILLFILCFLCIFSITTILVIQKPTNITAGFYQQRNESIDVLYVGSSHVYCSVSPIRLYEKYGFTGFIRATSCQRSWESYTLLEEALKYQKPKVVVYEVMSAYHDQPQFEAFSREIFDTMRPGLSKVRGIRADLEGSDEADMLSMYIPMIRYHERWKSLEKKDFQFFYDKDLLPYKGFVMTFVSDPAVDFSSDYGTRDISGYEAVSCSKKSEDYIRRMKAVCDENGIEFVMLKTPTFYAPYWNAGMSLGMEKLAADMGVPFIDYNYGDNIVEIDWTTETVDKGNHVNYSGAVKVTDAFGKWLKDNYDLPDHRGDMAYQDWNSSCEQYDEELARERLLGSSDYLEYMDIINQCFASDSDYVIMITAKSNILTDMNHEHLLKLSMLGNDLHYTDREYTAPNIFICNGDKIIVKKQTDDEITENYDIGLHRLGVNCLNKDGQEVCDLYIDGQIVGKNAVGLNIVLYDLKGAAILDSCYAKFDTDGILKIYRE